MKLIGISSRVEVITDYKERRDSLDQRWFEFLSSCGFTPILLPNNPNCLEQYFEQFHFDGFVLSGGNSHQDCGGNAPERDATDERVIEYALSHSRPLIGVCRGMQSLQLHFDHTLEPVTEQVTANQTILVDGEPTQVNSYHNWGTTTSASPLTAWAVESSGIIKAVRHDSKQIVGIMWHPERYAEFKQIDIDLFKGVFG